MEKKEVYYIYVGQLRKEFAKSTKAKLKNKNQDINKVGLYVGYSSKPPKERWQQHLNRARNKRGKLYSDVAADWGERYIHWKKFKKHNPIDTKTAAKEMEKKIAIKYRDKGYAVWSDQLPYLDPKKNKDK